MTTFQWVILGIAIYVGLVLGLLGTWVGRTLKKRRILDSRPVVRRCPYCKARLPTNLAVGVTPCPECGNIPGDPRD